MTRYIIVEYRETGIVRHEFIDKEDWEEQSISFYKNNIKFNAYTVTYEKKNY